MLDNSLKPLLRLKFPPAQLPASTPPGLGGHTFVETSPPNTSEISETLAPPQTSGIPEVAPPPVSRSPPLTMTPPKKKKAKIKPCRQRYLKRMRPIMRERWCDKVIALFVETNGEGSVFAASHREIVLSAFDRRLSKTEAVELLQKEFVKNDEIDG